MGYLRSYAAIGWTSTGDTAPTRVHLLGVPLRMTRPGFSQATYRAQSMDRSVIEALVVPTGAHELIGDVRYDADSQGLIDMLVAGSANTTLTYYPDVRDPSSGFACKLISPVGPELELLNDPQRASFGDTSITLRLRRTDQGPFTEQYIGTNALFWYRGGGSMQGFTFTRATTATQVGPGRGLYAATVSGKAMTGWSDMDADGYRETPVIVIAPARTNLVLQSENFGTTWTAVGTPTRSAAAKTCGSVSLDLIGDDSAAAFEGYTQTATFTANAVKAFSVVVAQGSSTSSVLRIEDTTAGATRLRVALTWVAGLPVATMVEGVYLGYERLANGCFRLHFQTTSITAGNTNSVQVYPATDTAFAVGNVGTLYAGAVQAENALYPGPYIPTTTGTVTRNDDTVAVPFTAQPQALTVYVRLTELGAIKDTAINERILVVGGTTGARIRILAVAGFYSAFLDNTAGANVSSTAAAAPVLGDTVELMATVTAAGVIQLTQAINGVAVTAAASAAQALDSAFNAQTVSFGETAANAVVAIANAVIVRGVQTLDAMRRIARVTQA